VKLIDILVQELPKRGGWPDGVIKMSQDYDKEVWAWFGNDYASVKSLGRYRELSDNHRKQSHDEEPSHFVTREQYEAALAANKPEWDGKGLPPVGLPVELQYWKDGKVEIVRVIAYHGNEAWVEFTDDCRNTLIGNPHFRPIRSEADKKRAEGVIALSRIDPQVMPFEYGDKLSDGTLIGPFWYELYDAIAAGKIPHIRID